MRRAMVSETNVSVFQLTLDKEKENDKIKAMKTTEQKFRELYAMLTLKELASSLRVSVGKTKTNATTLRLIKG